MADERKGGAGAAAAAAYLRASADDRKAASAGVAGNKKVILKSADMKEEMQKEAIDCALAAFEKHGVEKEIAEYIKKEFDKNHGPTWHCIVGRNFDCIMKRTEQSKLPVHGMRQASSTWNETSTYML